LFSIRFRTYRTACACIIIPTAEMIQVPIFRFVDVCLLAVSVIALVVVENGKATSAFVARSVGSTCSCRPHRRGRGFLVSSLTMGDGDNDNLATDSPPLPSTLGFHSVQGVRCREVVNELPLVGRVVVLEATADAQEELVDECLALEEEKSESKQTRIAEGDPYGAVLWPAAWAVSNYLLSEPDLRDNLPSLSVLELGTGTGLVSIAAAMGGAKRIIATDYEPLALALTRYAADNINHINNTNIIETQLLDMCALKEQPLPIGDDGDNAIDVVVAADIMYEPKTGIAMAHRAVEALRQNCRVIIGDSPGRVRCV